MKRLVKPILFSLCLLSFPLTGQAAELTIENKSDHRVKVSAIGGAGLIEPHSHKTLTFNNEETGADINIWWFDKARELCQIYTPWDRTITVTGKYSIQCLSRK